jgi:hypothetical protein
MASSLSFADFQLSRAVCETRYENAYMIYDRTGELIQRCSTLFTDVKVIVAQPDKSAFQADEGSFALELGASRFISEKAASGLEAFSVSCKQYFDLVTDLLQVKVFTRIGLRVIVRKKTKDKDEAKELLKSLKLPTLRSQMRFGASEDPEEVIFRWEGSEIGALVRLRAETTTVDVVLPPELEISESKIHQSVTGLTLDVDYYTVAPVERSQWDAGAWIPQALRYIKKETNDILQG